MEDFKRMSKDSIDRILKDFPWLWSIRSNWYRGVTYILVRNAEAELSDMESFCNRKFYKNICEIWIHHESDLGEWVGKVEAESAPLVNILKKAKDTSTIKHVVLVVRESGGASWVTVYRPPKGYQDFEHFLAHIQPRVFKDDEF